MALDFNLDTFITALDELLRDLDQDLIQGSDLDFDQDSTQELDDDVNTTLQAQEDNSENNDVFN